MDTTDQPAPSQIPRAFHATVTVKVQPDLVRTTLVNVSAALALSAKDATNAHLVITVSPIASHAHVIQPDWPILLVGSLANAKYYCVYLYSL